MSTDSDSDKGPDLRRGITLAQFTKSGMLLGYVDDKAVLLARAGDEVFAVGAACTHYNGPLAEGIIVDDTVKCPWHHACFSLRSGEALHSPAFDPLQRWKVERNGDIISVSESLDPRADGARLPEMPNCSPSAPMAQI